MANPEPYNPAFPIAYRADGDTTRIAINKHIQEILRLYSLLYNIDIRKLNVDEFNRHVNSSDPHPNLNINNTIGNIPADRIDGLDEIIAGEIPVIPNATTSQRGIIEIATDAEANAGTDTERAVVPKHLKQLRDEIENDIKDITGSTVGGIVEYYRGTGSGGSLSTQFSDYCIRTFTLPVRSMFIASAQFSFSYSNTIVGPTVGIRIKDTNSGDNFADFERTYARNSGPVYDTVQFMGGGSNDSPVDMRLALQLLSSGAALPTTVNACSMNVWVMKGN
jgi:hypothetical protein